MKRFRALGVVACALLFFLCVVPAACSFPLPDTEQRTCYQDVSPYAEIPCDGTGQDGAYTQNPLSYADNHDGTVTDNNTGLVWQKEGDGNGYNWYVATGTYHATLNPDSINACGSFGRLPSRMELLSIVDYMIPGPGPAIHPVFTNTTPSQYWSATKYASKDPNPIYADYARTVSFSAGSSYIQRKDAKLYVRCVRDGR